MRARLRRELAIVAAIAAASLVVRAAFALGTDVFQDEALYWWQAYGGLSFSPHPPAGPLLMHAGLLLFGHGLAGVRAGSLVAGTASIFVAYALARAMYGGRAGLWAALLFALCPLFVAVGAVATPDALLLLVWLSFIYVAWRAAQARTAVWWAALGVVFAAGMYTKYMMVLAAPSLGLALLLSKEDRRLLKTPGPWLAGALGTALFAPVLLLWDWRHGWPTLSYHLGARHVWAFTWGQIENYVFSHLGAISPLLIAGVLWALVHWFLWRRGRSRAGIWIASFGWVPIVFFLAPSAFTERTMTRVQWDAVGYAAGIVAFALLLRERGVRGRVLRRRRRFALAGMGVAGATLAGTLVVMLWPGLVVRLGMNPPVTRLLGWSELAERVQQAREEWPGQPAFIVGDSFRTALCVGFHLNTRNGVYTLFHPSNRRYGLTEELKRWRIDEPSMVEDRAGQDALYVHEYHFSSRAGADDPATRIHRFFSRVEKVADFYVVRGGRQLKHFGLFHCYDLEPKPGVRAVR